MATLTQPDWTPDQVTRLPETTEVVFEVTPRKTADGIHVTYRLTSQRLRFRPAAGAPPIPPEELAGSSPAPEALRRDDRVIEDQYIGPNAKTAIKRTIIIEKVGSENPGLATLKVTAQDIIGGTPQNASHRQDTVSFVLT